MAWVAEMSLPSSDHPIWNAITLAIAGLIAVGVLALRLAFGYQNGFDFEKDLTTILVQVGAFVATVTVGVSAKQLLKGRA